MNRDERLVDNISPIANPNSSTPNSGLSESVPRVATVARPGESVGDYEILEALGEGGMGVVYRARHKRLNRIVALKMIRAERADSHHIIRFLVEAEAVAAVKHAHVVQVYEFGDADGHPYIALEYLSGGTLK